MIEKLESYFNDLILNMQKASLGLNEEINEVRKIRDNTLLKVNGFKKVTLRAYLNDFSSIAFFNEDMVISPNLKFGSKIFLDKKECTVQDIEKYDGAGQNNLDLVRIVVTKI